MPAVSKAQQKFFGMVRALQKGDISPSDVTSNVRQAAKDVSAKDVKDFASTNAKKLPNKVDEPTKKEDEASGLGTPAIETLGDEPRPYGDPRKKLRQNPEYDRPEDERRVESPTFFEIVGKYNDYGRMLKREHTLSELGQQLSSIAEYAEFTLTNEMDDWFDAHTVRRNIKEMNSYAKEFQKIAQEADVYHQRMTALYDDMGRVLERYFSILDAQEGSGENVPRQSSVEVSEEEPSVAPVVDQHQIQKEQVGRMIERVISVARTHLTGENLAKFDTLPKEKQVRVAWRVLR